MAGKLPPIADYEHLGLDPRHHPRFWEAVNKGWQPGKTGKGIVVGNELYTWNTANGSPAHSEVLPLFGVGTEGAQDYLFIEPDGTYRSESYGPYGTDELVTKQDPRLKPLTQDTTWDFKSKAEVALPEWRPGKSGKGIVAPDGTIHTWQTDQYESPHHNEVIQDLGYTRGPIPMTFEITPMGEWDSWTNRIGDLKQALAQGRPDLTYAGDSRDGWDFTASMDDEEDTNHKLNWEPGQDGKGMLLPDGSVHTWHNDDYEVHNDYIADHPDLDVGGAHYVYISPEGKCSTAWGTLGPEHEDRLREADPRLYVDYDQGGATGWAFGN
jgi:hypothetical protein